MMAIHASLPAQRVSKVVLALQATGVFRGLTLAEVRRIGPESAAGIGGIVDRLLDPTPYVKLELVCADGDAKQLVDVIRCNTEAAKDGTQIFTHTVELPERS